MAVVKTLEVPLVTEVHPVLGTIQAPKYYDQAIKIYDARDVGGGRWRAVFVTADQAGMNAITSQADVTVVV